MTSQRLQEIVDAYGADPARWPADERDAAVALLAYAPGVAADAATLDALLDRGWSEAPSTALVARVLAQAPAARRARVRRLPVMAALSSLAAAAGLVLWLVRSPAPAPRAVADISIDDLGTYATATDVLLDSPGLDVLDTVPSMGCSDAGGLGCPEVPEEIDQSDTHDATSRAGGSLYA